MKKTWLIFLLAVQSIMAQGHTYPRTACWMWGGAVPEWYARFDLIVMSVFQPDQVVRDIKEINPDVIVLPTVDWNVGAHLGGDIPADYRARLDDGTLWGWYVKANPASSQYAPNYSTVCPEVNGKRAWEWFAEYIANRMDLSVWDGLATDGLYGGDYIYWNITSQFPRLDLDCNGVADLDEHDRSWAKSAWKNGVAKLEKRVRELIGPDKYIMINSGVGYRDHPSMSSLNGVMDEYYTYSVDWYSKWSEYDSFLASCDSPFVSICQSNPMYQDPVRPGQDQGKNDFSLMRFGLTQCMMGDAYFQYEDAFDAIHYWNRYYDEFDLDLGYPTSARQKLGSRNVWVRFFDHGAAIVNVTGADATITDAELSELDGYVGPYLRFHGGQDPATNNGGLFDLVTLSGRTFVVSDVTYTRGDGIVLVSEPTVCVSEIIIDESDVGTSPGSSAAILTGTWTKRYEEDGFRLRAASHITVKDLSAYAMADGSTSAEAVFTPTVGVAGLYRVYEWHPAAGRSVVAYSVCHANGTTSIEVDQAQGQNAWNLLGEFRFDVGSSGGVRLSSDGVMVADAIKFVCMQGAVIDTVPPMPPVIFVK